GSNLIVGQTSSSLSVTTSGNYSVIITDANGCSATSNVVQATLGIGPVVTIAQSGGVCNAGIIIIGYPGLPIVLTASGTGAVSWLWSTGATTQSITITTPGNYSVIGYDANGCPSASPASVTLTATNVACGH